MAVPKQKQDELWELGQERGERPVLESILRRYYPEKAEGILRLADEQGDTAVFDGMLRQMMDDGHFGEPFVAPITPPGFGDLRVAEEQQAKEIETVVEPKRQQEAQPAEAQPAEAQPAEAQPAKQVVAEPLRMQPQPAADVVELRQQEAKLETPFDRETSRKLRQQGYSEKEIQDMLPVIRGESVPHMATDKDMSPLEVPVTPPRRDMLAGSAHMPQRMEEGEVLGRAKPGEALVGAAKHLGLHLFDDFNKKYVQPYKTAKEVLWDVPMHKVEPKIAEGIRRGIAGMRRNMIYLPSVEDAKELIEARNWKAVGEMAKAGRFPTAEELGPEYIQSQLDGLAKEFSGQQRAGAGRVLQFATSDPSSSWLRRGEIPEVWSAEYVAKHGNKLILPMIITAPVEEVARIATHPSEWDDYVAMYVAGRLVLAPATKAGLRWMSKKGWATKQITPLKALGRKFPKKQPIGVDDIQSILKSDPDVSDDILRAFAKLSNQEKAEIARAVKMGKPVHLATPRFKGGEPAFGQPPVEHLASGIDAGQRPFYPPAPTGRPPAATPTRVSGAPPAAATQAMTSGDRVLARPGNIEGTIINITETGLGPQYEVLQDDGLTVKSSEGVLTRIEPSPAETPVGSVGDIGFQETLPALRVPTVAERAAGIPGMDVAGVAVPPTEALAALPEAGREYVSPEMRGMLRPFEEPAPAPEFYPPVVSDVPTAIPLDVTPEITRGFTGTQRPPEPVGLLPSPEETATRIDELVETGGTGITADQVNMLRLRGFSEQDIMGIFGPAGVLPEGGALGEAAPVAPTWAVVESPPPAEPEPTAIPLAMAEEPSTIEQPVPVEERPVRVLPKGRTGRVDILPGKEQLLADIDAALAVAPDEMIQYPEGTRWVRNPLGDRVPTKEAITPKVTLSTGDTTIEAFNTKEALAALRKRVAATPVTETLPKLPKRRTSGRRINPNKEMVGPILPGMADNYFSDGVMLVKGKPPKGTKVRPVAQSPTDPDALVSELLNTPTQPADPQYYLYLNHADQDIGVSGQPIASFDKDNTPNIVFQAGDKFAAFDQFRFNLIKKRYPDAKYGFNTDTGMLVAYAGRSGDAGEPVAALAARALFGQNYPVVLESPPGYTVALEAGLVDEMADAHKDIAELRFLDYEDRQIDRISGTDARDLIRDNIPAEEVRIDADGNVTRIGGASEPRPVTGTTEELTVENVQHQDEIRQAASEAGFVGIKRNPFGSSKPKSELMASSVKHTGSDEFGKAFYQSRDELMLWERMKRRIGRTVRETGDLVNAEANNYLWRAAHSGNYPEKVSSAIAQWARKQRTHYQTRREAGMQVANRDSYGIWGELDGEQSEYLENLIFLKRIQDTLSRGLQETADIQPDQAKATFTDQYRATDDIVRGAFDRYDKFQKAFSYQHLVDRGHLNPEQVPDFYAPERRVGYYWGGFMIPEPAKPRYKAWLQKQTGSKRGAHASLDAITKNWGIVHSDNMYEDLMLGDLATLDGVSRDALRTELGQDAAERFFAGMKQHDQIPVGKGGYRVVRFEPGRYMYPGLVANSELLREAAEVAAIDVDRLLSLPPDEQEKMLDRYFEDVGPRGGDAVRRAIIRGRHKRMYVVPNEVAWRLRGMRENRFYLPLLRDLTRLSSRWKTLVLTWAAVNYNLFQIGVDTSMQYLTAPGSIKSLPRAFKMMAQLHKLAVDPASLGPEIQETYEIAKDEGVFDSGFLREYMMLKPEWRKLSTYLQYPHRLGAKREVLNRVAMVDYQWHDRVKKGKPVEAIHFEKRMEGLTEKQKVGFIASKFTTDFEGTPAWYSQILKNFVFPFITGAHIGSLTLAKLMARMPYKRPFRFFGSVVAPIAAIHLWNNTGWRKAIRDRLGWAGGKWYTTILKAWDDDDDGVADRALVWSPRTNIDEAGEWIGIDQIMQRVRRLRRKSETRTLRKADTSEFVSETLKDAGYGPGRRLHELANPLMQFIEGAVRNKDPFTGKPIMPPDVKGTPAEHRYVLAYLLKKTITPIDQLARSRGGGNVPQIGPARWNAWARAVSGTVAKQFNPMRALGFQMIDLNRIQRSEQREEAARLVNARRGFLRRIREEFAWNRDLRMPEAVFDFYAETQQEFQNVAQGGHPTTPVGRVFEDARDRGVDLTPEMVGGGRQKGSVRNMLLHPRTWVEKLQYAKNEGVTQTLLSGTPTPLEEPRHLTKAEKEEFDLIMNALEDQDLQADLSTKPLGIRVELLQQVLGILGVNVEELLNSLDNQ